MFLSVRFRIKDFRRNIVSKKNVPIIIRRALHFVEIETQITIIGLGTTCSELDRSVMSGR